MGPPIVAVVLDDGTKKELDPEEALRVEVAMLDDDTVSPAQASMLLGVSRPMVTKWIREGFLPDVPVGSHHRVPKAAVLALKAERSVASRAALDDLLAAKAGDRAAARRISLEQAAAAELVAELYE